MLATRHIARLCALPGGPVALLATGLSMLIGMQAASPVSAQPYTELAQIKDSPEYAKKKTEMFAAGTTDDDGKKLFDQHYTFRIAEMTVAANYDKLAAKRDVLKQKDLVPLGRATSPELHDRLTRFLVTNLPKLCAGSSYHPAVRVNWTLILGDLNAKEPEFNGRGDVPLPEALPELQKLYVDENQHPAVRLAALVGITRHVKSNASAETRQRLAQAMAAMLATKKPKEFSQDAHDFFRRRTVDALRVLLEVAPDAGDATVAAALAALIADPNVKMHYRCEAAAALGMLEGRGFKKEQVPELARTLAELAVQITKPDAPPAAAPPNEIAPAARPPVAPPVDVPPGNRPPGTGGTAPLVANNPTAVRATLSRDVQGYFLACVRQGYKGSKQNRGLASVSVEADTKKIVDDLSAKVEEMFRLVTDKKVDDANLPIQLGRVNQGLQAMIRDQGAGKASADAGATLQKLSDRAKP